MWNGNLNVLVKSMLIIVILICCAMLSASQEANSYGLGNPAINVGKLSNIEISADAENKVWMGNKNAPILIVEFSDYLCPYCR